MTVIPLGIITWVLLLLFKKTFAKYALSNLFLGTSFVIIWAIAIWMLYTEFLKDIAEVPASWFGVLNSLFIIAMAPLFSKWWESKYNPNANMKYAIGMILLGIGMACVAIGASDIPVGAATASVSMIWLILVYFFHTMGELCISPVALSYVSKLVPGRMIAMMFGVWYLAVAIGMRECVPPRGNAGPRAGAHQLGAWILHLAVRIHRPGQQHLRLDPDQKRRHLQELARPVQPQPRHPLDRPQELRRDLRDRDVEDVNVLHADQVQQQVERTLKPLQLDHEAGVEGSGGGHQVSAWITACASP